MKKGFTILELLISIVLISVVFLLLLKVMMSLEVINHDTSYASDDEIARTEIIKNVENSFLEENLNGLNITKTNNKTIIKFMLNEEKNMEITDKYIVFDNEKYSLKSKNAKYDICINYDYKELENDYYLVTISIPVLINNINTTVKDDLEFTYMGLKNENTKYPSSFSC